MGTVASYRHEKLSRYCPGKPFCYNLVVLRKTQSVLENTGCTRRRFRKNKHYMGAVFLQWEQVASNLLKQSIQLGTKGGTNIGVFVLVNPCGIVEISV